MIINDSVLIIFTLILALEIFLTYDFTTLINHFGSAILAFITMFSLKKIGDYMFQKESMGGGDIKLMFVFGLVLGYPMSLLSIFLGSIIGLPASLILMKKNSEHIIPFGPFLAAGALIIILCQIDFDTILKLYGY